MKRQVSGIYIFSSYGGGSDFNTSIDNGCYDCYNEGSGIGFGIYISTNSDENSIIGNTDYNILLKLLF